MLAADSDDSRRLNRAIGLRRRCSLNAAMVGGFLCLCLLNLSAQTNVSTASTQSSSRYLFIVETSRAMRPRARGAFEAIKQALDTSLNGQIQPGDLVGIWTFNESVYQGLFPSQEWSQATQLAFAVRLPTLADPEIYLKRGRLEKVIPEMLKVISENKNVTIIFVSSGEGVMQGTPFSAQINSAWKEWHDEQEEVHLPLLTVLRTSKGQHIDWLFTPAPRPIELPALAMDSQASDDRESNPAGVILESGLVTKKPDTALAPEQQVAFSVWALGQTGLVTTAGSPQKTSMQKEDSAERVPAASSTPGEQPSGKQAPQSEPSRSTAAVSSPEQSRSAPAQSQTSETRQNRVFNESRGAASTSNDLTANVGKPVELVFVTNAPISAAVVPTSPVKAIEPAEETSSIEIVSPSPRQDVPTDNQLLAHARETKPEEDQRTSDSPVAIPRRSFLRENINPLVLMFAAAFGAAYCFRMWFLTQARVTGNATSLTHLSKGE